MKLYLIQAVFILSMLYPVIVSAEETNITFQSIQFSRVLPHAFIDQAKATLAIQYPYIHVLFEKRSSHISDATYSLIGYHEKENSTSVHIEGAVVKYPNAWIFKDKCSKEKTIERIGSV